MIQIRPVKSRHSTKARMAVFNPVDDENGNDNDDDDGDGDDFIHHDDD